MQFFPNARAISLMQALDVRYLVVHLDELAQTENSFEKSWLDRVTGLKLEQDFGAVRVYGVAPPTFSAAQLDKRVYLPQPAQAGAAYTAYLILVNTTGTPFAVKPTDKINFLARWGDARKEQVSTPLRLVTSEASIVS